MSAKPNCYECKHRGEVPGSAHSCCNHPAFAKVRDNPMFELAAMLGGGKGMPQVMAQGCKVTGHEQGIRGGWFAHPFNFDPVWLLSCEGFAPKAEGK